eukprot:TRINITY_DN8539_c0_g1_i1.p1 TRINITY_DN8539_c0_g1~~TRINITY_DN8539_c0_g1_i1.p1  ORF type:complete len:252 (-),score=24.11 TRINITY_DN8539_c0_g1_i1:17-667(-)
MKNIDGFNFSTPALSDLNSLTAGDMNGDGLAEIVTVSSMNVTVHSGRVLQPIEFILFRFDTIPSGSSSPSQVLADLNNDSFQDLLICVQPTAGNFGHIYAIFGKKSSPDSFPTNPEEISLGNGFIINGTLSSKIGDTFTAGDLNNDGFQDLIINLPQISTLDSATFIFYGKAQPFPASFSIDDRDVAITIHAPFADLPMHSDINTCLLYTSDAADE